MRPRNIGIILATLLLAIPATASDKTANSCPVDRDRVESRKQYLSDGALEAQIPKDTPIWWEGELRIYVVELVSSMGWMTSDGELYEFPFLAYAINPTTLSLNQTTWDTIVTWDGYDYNFNFLQEDNIAVQAVLFAQSDKFAEAAAMAYPGIPGSNEAGPGNTHTVFAEEASFTV